MTYTLEYSTQGNFRVSNENEESDWLSTPADGLSLMSFGEGDEIENLLVTLKNYDGELSSNRIYLIDEELETEVVEGVDETDDEEEEEEEEGEEEGDGDGDDESGDESGDGDDGDGDGDGDDATT